MPRDRLGVVVVVPPPEATEIQGLRRAVDDPVLDRIVAHLTLVPPVNVRDEDLPRALASLRRAARAGAPFDLDLGPVRSFAPVSPVLYLAVDGPAAGRAALDRVREPLLVAPLTPPERPERHPFVPHVTLAAELDADRLAAATTALAGYRAALRVSALHLLRHDRTGEGVRWRAIADVELGPPAVVGRGGVELALTTSTLVDPEAMALLAGTALELPSVPPGAAVPGADVVVTARRHHGGTEGPAVGVGWITGGAAPTVVVAEAERRQGIGRQIARALAARRPAAG